MREAIKPVFDFHRSVAYEELTGADMRAIARQYGKRVTDLDEQYLGAVTWALYNRLIEKVTFQEVDAWPVWKLKALYQPEESTDASEGKDEPHEALPSGALPLDEASEITND